MSQPLTYRDHAARCRIEADEATLDNVRERCLRAEAAWLQMAIRQESIARGREERDGRIPPEAHVMLTEHEPGDIA